MPSQYHNIIRDELANRLNRKRNAGDRWLAATEVASPHGRLDVVALHVGHDAAQLPHARVYEVKASRSDLAGWLKRQAWLDLRKLGAEVWLVVPESLAGAMPKGLVEDICIGVRTRAGRIAEHRGGPETSAVGPSPALVWSVARALHRQIRYGQIHIESWDPANEDETVLESA